MSFEELATVKVATVYGASKHEQKTTEAPSAVSIVTKDDIKKSGYRTLTEILNSVRGFYTTSDRAYSYIGVRGFSLPGDYGGRLLICIDGHRINDPIFDSAFNGMEFPLDVDLIERVEVIRGPGSSLYGNNAMLGVINVITRRGRDLNGVEVSGAYGSNDTWTGRLSYGSRFKNGVELALSGTFFDSAGHDSLYYPEFADVNGGQAENLDDSRAVPDRLAPPRAVSKKPVLQPSQKAETRDARARGHLPRPAKSHELCSPGALTSSDGAGKPPPQLTALGQLPRRLTRRLFTTSHSGTLRWAPRPRSLPPLLGNYRGRLSPFWTDPPLRHAANGHQHEDPGVGTVTSRT